MNLWLRLVWLFLRLRFGKLPRIGPFEEVSFWLRVWPFDLDTSLHMNNGRYLTLMDLARVEMLDRTGLLSLCIRKRWLPVLASATIRYHRELRLWQRFRLTCRVVGADERSVYMEQRLITEDEKVAAIALTRGAFRGPAGRVSISEMGAEMGWTPESVPQPSEALRGWIEADSALRDHAFSDVEDGGNQEK